MTDLADEKVSFFDAAILIFSPLAGLSPSRSGVALTLNFPNPGSDTSALRDGENLDLMVAHQDDIAAALPIGARAFAQARQNPRGMPADYTFRSRPALAFSASGKSHIPSEVNLVRRYSV